MSGRSARIARIAAAAAGAILLGLGLAAWGLSGSSAFNAWLTARIAARLGDQVRFAAVRLLWWPHPGVEVDQVTLVADAPAEGGAASAAALRGRLRLTALLAGRLEFAALRVDGLRVTVDRGADGRLRAGGLERFAAQAAPSAATAPLPPLPVLQLRDADIELRGDDRAGAPALRLHPLNGRLTPRGAGAQLTAAGRVDGGGSVQVHAELAAVSAPAFTATVDADQLDAGAALAWLPPSTALAGQGRLRVAATLSGQGAAAVTGHAAIELADGELASSGWRAASPLRLAADGWWNGTALQLSQGHLDAGRVSGPAGSVETLAASFQYADGALRVAAGELRAYGGTWRGSGQATLDAPSRFDVTLEGVDIDGAQLFGALGGLGISNPRPQFAAPLRVSATATGPAGHVWSGHIALATDGAAQWSTVRADGPLQIATDLRITDTAIALSGGRASARRVVVGGLTADAIDAQFTYGDSALRVAPLRGRALGSAWSYRGSLPVASGTPWSGQLNGTRVSAGALSGVPGLDGMVDLSADLAGSDTTRVTGSATLRLASDAMSWNGLQVEPPAEVRVAGRLDGTRLTVSNGRASIRGADGNGLTARDVNAVFTYADATLRVATIEARAAGGTWHATAVIPFTGAPAWSGTVDARHVDLDPLLRTFAGGRAEGAVAHLSLHLAHAADGTPHGSATAQLASGTVLWNDLRVDAPAHARGAFAVHGGAFTLTDASADAARAEFGTLIGTDATAVFRYAGDRLSFTHLQFQSCGGTWKHSGWFTTEDGGPFEGRLRVEGAAPPAVAAMIGDEDFSIPFARVDLESEVSGRATADWLPTLRGAGSVFFTDGTVRAATVLRPIWEALMGSGRVTATLNRATTHVAQISDTFALRRGRLDTTDFSMISDDYNVTAVGSIGLDGTLDLTSRIQLTAQGVQKMLVIGSVPLPTSVLPSLPPIPAFVTGSLANPTVRPDLADLPAATAHWIVSVVLHVPRSIGSTVLQGLEHLWNRVTGSGDAADQAPQQP